MGLVTSLIVGGIAAAGAVSQARTASKTRKANEDANELSETRAKEAAALDQTKTDTDADFVFGASKGGSTLLRKARSGTASASSGVSGGVGGFGGGSIGGGLGRVALR